ILPTLSIRRIHNSLTLLSLLLPRLVYGSAHLPPYFPRDQHDFARLSPHFARKKHEFARLSPDFAREQHEFARVPQHKRLPPMPGSLTFQTITCQMMHLSALG